MPFIQGRYHINPILGQALEAAREAEAALTALEEQGSEGDQRAGEFDEDEPRSMRSAKGPIHRVEIEAAELVPSHSGRAERGYVAKVHRMRTTGPETGNEAQDESTGGGRFLHSSSGTQGARGSVGASGRVSPTASAETHVFANHGDLADFLREELARDCRR